MSTKPLVLGLSLVLALGVSLALASTTTNAPGSACVAVNGTLLTTGYGTVENDTATAVVALCPTDRIISPAVSTTLSATVWVVDESSTASVCCTVISAYPGGNAITSAPACTSLPGKSGNVSVLSVSQITDTKSFSSFFVSCTLPATEGNSASQILTYRTVQD